jgi:hypothetical protein
LCDKIKISDDGYMCAKGAMEDREELRLVTISYMNLTITFTSDFCGERGLRPPFRNWVRTDKIENIDKRKFKMFMQRVGDKSRRTRF